MRFHQEETKTPAERALSVDQVISAESLTLEALLRARIIDVQAQAVIEAIYTTEEKFRVGSDEFTRVQTEKAPGFIAENVRGKVSRIYSMYHVPLLEHRETFLQAAKNTDINGPADFFPGATYWLLGKISTEQNTVTANIKTVQGAFKAEGGFPPIQKGNFRRYNSARRALIHCFFDRVESFADLDVDKKSSLFFQTRQENTDRCTTTREIVRACKERVLNYDCVVTEDDVTAVLRSEGTS